MQRRTPLFVLLSLLFTQGQAAAQTPEAEVDLIFVTIPAGQFIMGTQDLNKAIADLPDAKAAMVDDETPAHKVIFEKPFLLSQTEVTQQLWLSIMGTKPGPDVLWQAKNWAAITRGIGIMDRDKSIY